MTVGSPPSSRGEEGLSPRRWWEPVPGYDVGSPARRTITCMEDPRAALERLRSLEDADLEALCRRHGVRVLTVFGSTLDDREAAPRDLDIGVIFEPDAAHDVETLFDDLSEVLGTDRLDLLDAERASETARVRAIADGEPIHESEPTAYATAAADALFLETAWMRDDALASLGR